MIIACNIITPHLPSWLFPARVTTIYEHCKAFLSEIRFFLFPFGLEHQKGGVQGLYIKLDTEVLIDSHGHHWAVFGALVEFSFTVRLRLFSASLVDVSRSFLLGGIVDHPPANFQTSRMWDFVRSWGRSAAS